MAGVAVAAAIGGAAVIGGVTSYLGAQAQADAAEQAANAQREAGDKSIALQREMFNKQIELQQPWYDVGVRALPQLESRVDAMPAAFTGKVDLTQDPGYAFRLKEGLNALDRTASARGNLLSGASLKAAARYGQDYASQEYGNAYSRALDIYNANVAREAAGYNRLASLAGVGQTTAGNLATQAGQFGTNASNITMSVGESNANSLLAQGNARASQYQAIGNAIGGVVGAYGNYKTGQQNQANFDTYMSKFPTRA